MFRTRKFCIYNYGMVRYTCITVSSLVGTYKSVFDTHYCTYKTAYTDAYKTKYAMPAYTTVILKMNPRVRNMQKISDFKY